MIDRSAAESVWSPHLTNRFLKSPLRALIILEVCEKISQSGFPIRVCIPNWSDIQLIPYQKPDIVFDDDPIFICPGCFESHIAF
jgi:hypothetical protein